MKSSGEHEMHMEFFIQSLDHGILPKRFGKIALYHFVAETKNKIIQSLN